MKSLTCSHQKIIKLDDLGKHACGKCCSFISEQGEYTLKADMDTFESDVVPFDHYRAMIDDEKHQEQFFNASAHEYILQRPSLIDLILKECKRLRQREYTQYLAIHYMDCILSTCGSIGSKSFTLIALSSLMLAAKFDELDINIPFIMEMQRASGFKIGYDQFVFYEAELLLYLNWDLMKITPHHFLNALLNTGVVCTDDSLSDAKPIQEDLEMVTHTVQLAARHFAELVLKDYDFLRYKPSIIANSCIMAARVAVGF